MRQRGAGSAAFPQSALRAGGIPWIDAASCSRCGLCLAVCPSGAIDGRASELGWLPFVDERRCVRCELCVAVCPEQAAEVAFEIVTWERSVS